MRSLRSWLSHNLVSALGLLVVVVGGLAYVQTIVEIRQATACQAEYNAAFDAALKERASAAAAERVAGDVFRGAQLQTNRAQRNLIITVMGNTEQDPAIQQQSYQAFLAEMDKADQAVEDAAKVRAEADLTRQQNPTPTNRCD